MVNHSECVWSRIRHAYLSKTGTWYLMVSVFRAASGKQQLIFSAFTFLFALMLTCWVVQQGWFWLVGVVVTELGLLVTAVQMKDGFLLREYSVNSTTKKAMSDENHQLSRYLSFCEDLTDQGISISEVRECMELVDHQIDMAASRIGLLDKPLSFSFGVLSGLLAVVWTKILTQELTLVFLSLILVIMLLSLFASMVPSSNQRYKELKNYMLLYCHRCHVIP